MILIMWDYFSFASIAIFTNLSASLILFSRNMDKFNFLKFLFLIPNIHKKRN